MPLVDSLSPTTEEWGEGKGEGIPISRANSMEGTPLPGPSPLVPRREREWGAFRCAPVRIKKTYGFDFANVFRHVPSLGKEVLNVIVRGW